MVHNRSQFFLILNDISKEKNLTFIRKIPTRLTGIKSLFVMESPSLPSLSSARPCTHAHTHAHTLRRCRDTPGGSRTSGPACGTEVNQLGALRLGGPTFRPAPGSSGSRPVPQPPGRTATGDSRRRPLPQLPAQGHTACSPQGWEGQSPATALNLSHGARGDSLHLRHIIYKIRITYIVCPEGALAPPESCLGQRQSLSRRRNLTLQLTPNQ